MNLMTFLKNSSRSVLEKELSVVTPKLDFMRSTELVRRSMAGSDQLLQDLSTGNTEIKFAEKEVSLKNL